jgi:histidyl-tRNA synthetase
MGEQGVVLPDVGPLVAVVGFGEDHADRLRVATALRATGLAVRPDGTTRKLGKQLESAGKAGATWAVIVGDELREGRVGLKNLATGDQQDVPMREVAALISG